MSKLNPDVSIIVPLYNEAESLSLLHREIIEMCKNDSLSAEILFIDDGSRDETRTLMKTLHPLRRIHLIHNYGQTAALSIGIKEARGEIIVLMDGDLENNPNDIPRLLEKISEGYDVVSGWRKDRWKSHVLFRRLPSIIANKFISLVTGVALHDHGCTLKAYRSSIIKNIFLTGDMHRMIAAYAKHEGARVTEITVAFRERKFGQSKYGISRMFKVLLDVFAYHFFYTYARRPIHFFGALGLISLLCASIFGSWAVYLKFIVGTNFIRTPLPILVALCILVGIQFILMGLLAELISRNKKPTIMYEEIT